MIRGHTPCPVTIPPTPIHAALEWINWPLAP